MVVIFNIVSVWETTSQSLIITKKARLWLAKNGYTDDFGARPLTRALQKFIESPLSKKLLQGEYKAGDVIAVDLDPEDEDKLVFKKK